MDKAKVAKLVMTAAVTMTMIAAGVVWLGGGDLNAWAVEMLKFSPAVIIPVLWAAWMEWKQDVREQERREYEARMEAKQDEKRAVRR